jgi:predicted nuclease of predicted toxin-antitoxin system
MRIKIDENISRHLKPFLTQEGHEAATAGEEGLLGKTDAEVGAAAKAEGMLLFTLDLEFADLRKFPPGSHPGVVLFRPQGVGPISVNRFILDFVKTTNFLDLAGCTVVVDPTRVRVRRPSSDTNESE